MKDGNGRLLVRTGFTGSIYETSSRTGLIYPQVVEMPRMRPAIDAGLIVLLEAADPYMRPVLRKQGNVLPVEIRLSKLWSRSVPDRQGGT